MTDQNILNSVPSITVKSAQFSECTGDVYRWSDEFWRSVKDVKELVELRKANAGLDRLYAELYFHASALTFGTDWNKGTHALLHGHRKGLIDAVKALKEQPKNKL
jgi:hypothetical protein